MKSLKDYSLNITEEEYHSLPAWSHSKVARYAREGFSAIANINEPIKPSPEMEFGSLFDSMITSENTNEKYVVLETVPPPAEKAAMDALLEMTSFKKFEDIPEEAFAAATTNYQSRWGLDTKIKKLAQYQDYFNIKRTGKKIVSPEDWKDAKEMVSAFYSNILVSEIFKKGSENDIEYIYQSKFTANMTLENGESVLVKIMPDLLIVNHSTRIIIPVDLKTSSVPAYQFADNFIKFRYDIQASMYSDVLANVINSTEEFNDYEILHYYFVDISRSDKVPVTYVYNQYEPFSFKGFTYKGWKQLLGEIVTYKANQAVLPDYILPDEPNDIIKIIESK